MSRWHLLCGCIAVVLASASGMAIGQEAKITRKEALLWLEKALECAGKIDNTPRPGELYPDRRAHAMRMIASTYLQYGEVDRAKAVAAKLPKDDRRSFRSTMVLSLAFSGHIDKAVRELETLDFPVIRESVATSCAKTDAPKAMAIAAKLPESERGRVYARIVQICAERDVREALALVKQVPTPHRNGVYVDIVKQQVLTGDVKGARNTSQSIPPGKERKQAELWLLADKLYARNTPLKIAINRGREDRLPGPPSRRTVRAVLPHTALQSVVHPRGG